MRCIKKYLDESAQQVLRGRNQQTVGKIGECPIHQGRGHKIHEVGYVSRDVEQIIRDLVDAAINSTRIQMREDVSKRIETGPGSRD